MLISRAWIESMLPAAVRLSDAELGDAFTMLGLEVEGMRAVGRELDPIIVGEVRAKASHPHADKLTLVTLWDGSEERPVVCGAGNVPTAGGKVVFAPVGTRLRVSPSGAEGGDLEIGAREIRGVRSEGMICSERELDIGPDHEGILVLPDDTRAGTRLAELAPGLLDTIYELSITPNRPDALGHVGVARDLAVKLHGEVAIDPRILPDAPVLGDLVTLQAPQRCGRYIGRAFTAAKVGPSPLWLRVRLHRLGLRPINSVVDITNLVLMQWGQPLHIFDRSKLDGGRVVVRMANAGEPITTLDDKKIELDADDLVIADASRPQAIAGVMGGLDSGVLEGDRELLLEAAWFQPGAIRRTARRHGLNTDSSYRFERGVDHGPNLTAAAAEAAALVEQLTGARCVGGQDVRGELPSRPAIELRPARTTVVLGMDVPVDEARRVLEGLEIEVQDGDPQRWRCLPPSWRPDLQREEDLIEEIMRHHGLDRLPAIASIPSEPPGMRTSPEQRLGEQRGRFEDRLADALARQGLLETVTFAFADPTQLQWFAPRTPHGGLGTPIDRAVRVANPMRVQSSLLRTHMLPGLLGVLALNVARHGREVRLFEMARIYDWPPQVQPGSGPTASIDEQLPRERRRACVLVGDGVRDPDVAVREMVGLALDVLAEIGCEAQVRPVESSELAPWLHPGAQARLRVESLGAEGARDVGEVGEVHPDLLRAWDIGIRAFYAELWLETLPIPDVPRYRAVPRFPATSRDLSLEVPIDLPASAVVSALVHAESEATTEGDDPPRLSAGDRGRARIEVLEDYRGQGVPDGHRALLLRLHYRAESRSVTDAEVQERHAAVVDAACRALRARAPTIKPR
jgi:phenylalanyl-tRNA synthetase beta chain